MDTDLKVTKIKTSFSGNLTDPEKRMSLQVVNGWGSHETTFNLLSVITFSKNYMGLSKI